MKTRFDYELFATDIEDYITHMGIGFLANESGVEAQTIRDILDGREPSIDDFIAIGEVINPSSWQDYFVWGE